MTPDQERLVHTESVAAKECLIAIMDLPIQTQEDTEFASSILVDVKRKYKELDTKRKEIVDPLNAALKKVNDLFRAPLTYLADAETSIKRRLSEALQRSRFEAQRALVAAANAAAEQDAPALEAAIVSHDVAVALPRATGVSYRQVWTFEVVDPALVPREFLVVDERTLKAIAISQKENAAVPGVRFFATDQVVAR